MGNKNDNFDDDNAGFFASLGKNREGVPMPDSMVKIFKWMAIAVVLSVVLAVIWAVWPSGGGGSSEAIPVVHADEGDYKIAPEDKGGMPIPNKDSTIFETLDKSNENKEKVENLLEDEETPMKKENAFATDETPPPPTALADIPKEEPKIEEPKEEEKVAAKVEKPKSEPEPEPKKIDIIDQLKEDAGTKKVETPKPVVKPAVKGNVFIQLASVKSDADAKAKWTKLKSSYPALKPFSMRMQRADLGAKGIYYRVQAGPMPADKATSVCSKVKSSGGDCLVVK